MKDNRTVSRILQILELIAKHDEGLTLGQIYRMLDIPKATVYDFLQTLIVQMLFITKIQDLKIM
mgnify:CR=1 FL=1